MNIGYLAAHDRPAAIDRPARLSYADRCVV